MKTRRHSIPFALASICLLFQGQLIGQVFTNLYSFSAFDLGSAFVNSDGGVPLGEIVISSNTLYGTAFYGGSSGEGTVFSINLDGTGFTSLYSFAGGSSGKFPRHLVLSDSILYGSAGGGANNSGLIFGLNTDGSGFTDLYDFSPTAMNSLGINTNADGGGSGYLTISGSQLYGTSSGGGPFGNGTVFVLNTDGTGFKTLHAFTYGTGYGGFFRNADGSDAEFVLVSGDTLYGTTTSGGSSGYGTVFKLKTDGTGFTILHNFSLPKGTTGQHGTNIDGAAPATLVLSGTTLYGTTQFGGRSGNGTLFKMNIDGTGFTTIYDGELLFENTSFILSGDTLYWWSGDLCSIKTNGTGLTTLHAGGYFRATGLALSGHTLFGTTPYGGDFNNGSVFNFLIPPQITMTAFGSTVTLTWPTNATGFSLQSATTLANGGDWQDSTLLPTNDLVTVTISTTASLRFFRLRHP